MGHRFAGRIAWTSWALALAMAAASLVFVFLNRATEDAESSGPLFEAVLEIAVMAFPTVGALVASRRPANPIGWLLCATGVALGLSSLAYGWAQYALVTAPGALPGAVGMAWLSSWLFLPPLFATGPFLFLLSPDGRLPSRRWRLVAWFVAADIALFTLAGALRPGPLEEVPFDLPNPVGIDGAGALVDVVTFAAGNGVVIGIVASALALLLRLRSARGVERQQLKWIASAAALFALMCVIGPLAFGPEDPLAQLIILIGFATIPVATGIAILRHRLYDIDVVINRALVYGALTATLGATYLGAVLILGRLLAPLTEGSSLAVAGSTLAVAALFRPLRARIQETVDRRFYRRRYDAARTLAAFSARLREQDDLSALDDELDAAVRQTLQPTHVSLWLFDDAARRGGPSPRAP